jgi:hypothetical protein
MRIEHEHEDEHEGRAGTAGTQVAEPSRRLGEERDRRLETVRRYAEGPLARRLGVPGRPAQIEPAEHGKRSLVYFVAIAGAPPAVLRAVPRMTEAWTLGYNLRFLRRLGLPAPTLLAADFWPLTRLRWGFWPVVEERIEGQDVAALGRTEPAVRAVAATLARFHNVERRRWGRPMIARWGSYRRHLLARMARRARTLDSVLEAARADELVRWCRERATAAPLGPPFALTHGRVFAANFLVTPANRAYALDLVECRFAPFGHDVVWALEQLCEGEAAACEGFLGAYFAARPAGCREVFERSRAFFEVDYHLARASIYARRLPRRRHVPQAREQKRAVLHQHAARLSELTGIELTVAGVV